MKYEHKNSQRRTIGQIKDKPGTIVCIYFDNGVATSQDYFIVTSLNYDWTKDLYLQDFEDGNTTLIRLSNGQPISYEDTQKCLVIEYAE